MTDLAAIRERHHPLYEPITDINVCAADGQAWGLWGCDTAQVLAVTKQTWPAYFRDAAPRTMTVRVTLTIEVDRDAYDAEYHGSASAAEIREHIQGVSRDAIEHAFNFTPAITLKDDPR